MSTLTFPLQNYPTGTTTFGPIALTQGLNGCVVRIARCTTSNPTIWPSATQQITISLDVSYDGGVTYQINQFAFNQAGGIITGRNGEIAEDVVTFNVSPQVPTHVKGFVRRDGDPAIAGGAIRTGLSLTTF